MSETCEVCGKQIKMMSQLGTGVCSEFCRKDRDNDHGPAGGRRRHRGTASSPSPQRGTTTF